MALFHGRNEPIVAGTPNDVLGDRAVMARALAYLFGSGVALALLSLALPRSVEATDLQLLAPTAAACATAAVAVVAVLLRGARLLRLWTFQCVLACGTLLITAAIHFSGELSPVYAMFYVWIALYAFYFFSPLQAALQLGFVAIAYSTALFGHSIESPLARWLIPVGTLVVAGALIATLKGRIHLLVGRLSDVARTDALTGLANRRGFEEALELELERARRTDRPACLVLADVDRFKELNDSLGHRGGDRALRDVGEVLSEATRRIDTVARVGGDEFAVVMPNSDEREGFLVAERIRGQLEEAFRGVGDGVTISLGVAGFPHHGADGDALVHAADQALYAAKERGRDRSVIHDVEIANGRPSSRERAETPLATVISLAEVLDRRDRGTSEHSRTVAHYAELTARELGLPRDVIGRVGIGAMLHDVGKIAVSESVLRKRGTLSDEEWGEIRRHPELGARILESVDADDIRKWVLAHHERPDGKGYPFGLRGAAIPIAARIIAVAEAYAAMTGERRYRSPLSSAEARLELAAAAGSQFDEEVLDAFFRVLDRQESPVDAVPA
jgi:diguanylate cyclase (GGDEF)-like protein/putative nucleotidyltransferase with HDIG domain